MDCINKNKNIDKFEIKSAKEKKNKNSKKAKKTNNKNTRIFGITSEI